MLRWSTAGESHGPSLIGLIEGLPSGVPVTTGAIAQALERRRGGYGRSARQTFERDSVSIVAGVRHGFSTGAPIALQIENSEWAKWKTVMGADPVAARASVQDVGRGDTRELGRARPLTTPRPGHADLAGMVSYRARDARDILERASARETAAVVALGAIAKSFLGQACGIEIAAQVVAVGGQASRVGSVCSSSPWDTGVLDVSPMRTLDADAEKRFMGVVDAARENGDTVGGVVQVCAWGVPIGLGSHVASDRKLDAAIAAALMGIQSAKAVEIGDGMDACADLGSLVHDHIVLSEGRVRRASNRCGGIEGGTSNGEPIVARVAFKPIPTVANALPSVDLATFQAADAFHQRSDTCQVVPAALVAESQLALVLARALVDRFGGYSLAEVQEQVATQRAYQESVLSGGSVGGRVG